jgi:hypothetical protein
MLYNFPLAPKSLSQAWWFPKKGRQERVVIYRV